MVITTKGRQALVVGGSAVGIVTDPVNLALAGKEPRVAVCQQAVVPPADLVAAAVPSAIRYPTRQWL